MNSILLLLSKVNPIILFFVGALTIVSGDLYAKKWSISIQQIVAYLSIFFYIIGGLIFISLVKSTNSVGISNVLWNIIGIIGTLIISYLFFHEIITARQMLGIILGLFSIILITY